MRTRWPLVLAGVLAAWYLAVLVWAVRPTSDTVPTGVVNGVATFETVTCHAPLSSSALSEEALPVLAPPRAFERDPCVQSHRDQRRLFWFDTVAFTVGLAALTVLGTRHRAHPAGGADGGGVLVGARP